MRKGYIRPQLHSINLNCGSLLCGSMKIKVDETVNKSEETDIWSNSESKFNSSIWDD